MEAGLLRAFQRLRHPAAFLAALSQREHLCRPTGRGGLPSTDPGQQVLGRARTDTVGS
ncbi:hypothetical protein METBISCDRAFT_28727 [Metschnikowia bicuspidata]|uniref:Uncharacterized protein n=1 Tax=Metschnikowia bicuspidata TaxID=27322 RepID=A0A4V1J2K2_9ASCO|nr:hypothetical protein METBISCDRAFT_28727 [Metschnikowia bicuspidata]